jgi:hypothetical protein
VHQRGQQLLEQRLELSPLGRRQRREEIIEQLEACLQRRDSRPLTGPREDERARARVAARSALDQRFVLESIDDADGRRMRDAQQAGEEVDVPARPQPEMDQGGSCAQAALAGGGQFLVQPIDDCEGERAEQVGLADLSSR